MSGLCKCPNGGHDHQYDENHRVSDQEFEVNSFHDLAVKKCGKTFCLPAPVD